MNPPINQHLHPSSLPSVHLFTHRLAINPSFHPSALSSSLRCYIHPCFYPSTLHSSTLTRFHSPLHSSILLSVHPSIHFSIHPLSINPPFHPSALPSTFHPSINPSIPSFSRGSFVQPYLPTNKRLIRQQKSTAAQDVALNSDNQATLKYNTTRQPTSTTPEQQRQHKAEQPIAQST